MSERSSQRAEQPSVVALGGGHGLAASLSALRLVTDRLTAVVTVADDGGSSGRLRAEFGALPPGDLRMALSALCDDTDWGRTWRDVLQHRFASDGPLDGHAMGNLLILSLWELLDDPVAGLDWVGKLLGARGRVLPMSCVGLGIEAKIEWNAQTTTVTGQAQIAKAPGAVHRVRLVPDAPKACAEAVAAVYAADWVVLGPGSWFTSVLPHLLVPQLATALITSDARVCVTLNLPPHTLGSMSVAEHLDALVAHAPDLRVDVVVVDPVVAASDAVTERIAALGSRMVVRSVAVGDGTPRHDALRLAGAYRDAFDEYRLGDSRGTEG